VKSNGRLDLKTVTHGAKHGVPNRPPAGERAHGYVGILLSREEQAALRPALSRENRQGRNPVGPAGRNRGGDLPAGGGVAEVGIVQGRH